MDHHARRTRIVCTLGPASADQATIGRLIDAGMNVARINMSHGDHDGHAQTIERLRHAAAERGVPVAILQDLQGPKIRIGALEGGGPVILVSGADVTISTEHEAGTAERLTTPYAALPWEVKPGERILLADGLIELRVTGTAGTSVHCQVVNGGRLFERQGMNLPGTTISAPSLTEKDLTDLAWGIDQGVDYVAVSFVRRAEDILAARTRINEAGAAIPIIAKLEKPQALTQLDDILEAADGVMVARGDMGVELPPEDVPIWQKRIIAAANHRQKIVITATQMLESMVHNPRPTRAEVTDVANAIWDGTDAVMLSAETAAGAHPVAAVAVMDRVARRAEAERAYLHMTWGEGLRADVPHAIGLAAHTVSGSLSGVAAIVAFTRDGATARLISKDRPAVPILALTDDDSVWRRLALVWGVHPIRSAPVAAMPAMLAEADRAAREAGVAATGDTLLVVGHFPPEAPGSTNFLTLHQIEEFSGPVYPWD